MCRSYSCAGHRPRAVDPKDNRSSTWLDLRRLGRHAERETLVVASRFGKCRRDDGGVSHVENEVHLQGHAIGPVIEQRRGVPVERFSLTSFDRWRSAVGEPRSGLGVNRRGASDRTGSPSRQTLGGASREAHPRSGQRRTLRTSPTEGAARALIRAPAAHIPTK
jgi:hypothetical protein